jgi:hypothetical protein
VSENSRWLGAGNRETVAYLDWTVHFSAVQSAESVARLDCGGNNLRFWSRFVLFKKTVLKFDFGKLSSRFFSGTEIRQVKL